jgi:type I restriction enzyme S subunit
VSQALKSYPEYKDSGLQWLGKIPVHWTEKRAKYFFREVDERSSTGQEEMLSVSHITGVTPRSQKNVTMFKAESNVGHKLCHPCDLVINTMWAWMGALGVAKQTGIVSPSIYRPIRSNAFLPEYIDHLLRTKPYVTEYINNSTGVRSSRLRLYPEKFLEIPIICPSYQEQTQMLAFIGAKDRLIHFYIRAKRQLMKLLNEQKHAIIKHTVTLGLDPNVCLKPSGVEWLGDVPEHWRLRKLKFLTSFENGIAFKPGDWKDSGIPIIRIQNLNGSNEFNYTDRDDLPKHLLVHPNDLLFSWSGNRGTSFGPFLWDRAFVACLNQHIFKLSGYSLHKAFFYYLLNAVTRYVEEQTHGIIGLVHITKPELGAISVPVPPDDEQIAIARYLHDGLKEQDALILHTRREIALINEYRTRFIAEVVTGKLDVRSLTMPTEEKAREIDDWDEGEELEAEEMMDVKEAADDDN